MPAFEVLSLDPTTPQIRAPGAGDTYSFPRAITPSGANVTPITVSGYSLTGSNAQSMLDLSGTWNTTGTPAAISLNVTDTASNAASRLLNLQVGGANRFYVSKSGGWFSRGSATNTDWFGEPSTVQGWFLFGYGTGSNPVFGMSWSGPEVVLASGATFGWSFAGGPSNGADLKLFRDAANTLAQRNGVNAQTFRVYNTFTDASNYERGFLRWSSNLLEIGAEAAGTGTARDVRLRTGSATWQFNANSNTSFPGGNIVVGNSFAIQQITTGVMTLRNVSITTGAALEFCEQTAPASPSTNFVRIYAEDNGSGKTRLMALFATGAAQQIAIEP